MNSKNVVSFSKEELSSLFEKARKPEIIKEIVKQNISFGDFESDSQKKHEIAKILSDKISQHRDDHEIFAAIYIFSDFYDTNSEICFELKDNFNTNKDTISSLEDLNKHRSESLFLDSETVE